jgi:hypothetical protein
MVNIATGRSGEYPGWMQLTTVTPSAGDFYGGTTNANDIEVSWAARLLNEIDHVADWNSLKAGTLGANLNGPADDLLPRVELFNCPSDAQVNQEAATLTYSMNTGGPDVRPTQSQNWTDNKANGMGHNLVPDLATGVTGPKVRFGTDVPDGADRTILLSENVHKDHPGMPGASFANNWLRTEALGSGNPAVAEQYFGMVWVFGGQNVQQWQNPYQLQERINRDSRDLGGNYQDEGRVYARPASAHPDLFIVSWASGATQSIGADIEYRVYQQLMTPNGAKCVWTEAPNQTLPNAFLNADPTMRLTDSDLE